MNNLKLKISSRKNIIIPALISIMPFTMYFLFFKGMDIDNYKITQITSYFFVFKIFYLFCFSLLFNLNNKKNTVITFLIFLFVGILSVFIPSSEFTFKDIIDIDKKFIFFVHTILNKNLFLDIIFFIMFALSFNEYKSYKDINQVFTFSANIMILTSIIPAIISVMFIMFFAAVINLLKGIIMNIFDNTLIVFNVFILSVFYIFAFTPFIIYFLYKKDVKNISIYFSRIIMYISLYNMFKHLFSIIVPIIPYSSPYDIRSNFIIYNVALAIGAVNLFFVRIDYKASIFTKIVYIIFPLIAFIFNMIIFSSLIYRIKEYGISPNKLTLIFTNIIILIHFILIIFDNIKSLKKLGSMKNIKDIILTNNRSCYVYVYGIIAFIVCFIMPLFYNIF
ncbi:hypothetical protein BHAMNSH16_03520 [Brachyspira hampsonii]|uniref:Uncharacterized protein n=2 Tax=Brachyspira hampsonii TaxID=1287055 RepID=A0AAC9TUQ8_9SPIR|nr:hypothetical protein BHAMNSH16_03520 [Brachyspira hampsonii]MBW5410560.1 hypothetical protein [Brachyspira hampsonii]OEJ14294.1 hypothetical protein A9496_01985 [Brachyspira hampsonii]